MAGRGGARGRGGRGGLSKSFNKEQLAAMGAASATEILPGPVTQPPPLYPLLDRKPVPLVVNIPNFISSDGSPKASQLLTYSFS